MTIHDELVLKLIDADKWGKATGYVIKIAGSSDIDYLLEELYYLRTATLVEMCPFFLHDGETLFAVDLQGQ